MDYYYINKIQQSEIIVDKSKFISFLIPFDGKKDLKEILLSIKKEHPKARHYIYATINQEYSKSSDDGEPSGVAGRPTLDLLTKKELMNVLLVTVRYFGGIKLGAGRLLRTYVNSAKEVIDSTTLYRSININQFSISIHKKYLELLKNILNRYKAKIDYLVYNNDYIDLKISGTNLKEEDLSEVPTIIINSKEILSEMEEIK